MPMRRTMIVLTAWMLCAVTGAAADDAGSAMAVIDTAIKAHGGPSALAKTELMIRTDKGVLTFSGQDVPFTGEITLQLPERGRWSMELGAPGQKTQLLYVINQDKGWQSSGGAIQEMGEERVKELRDESYVLWLSTLLPLKKDNAFKLTTLPDAKVDGKPAAGVKVAHKDHTPVKLYFDKGTGLLVKVERRAREAGLVVDKEYNYSGHKAFEGVLLPTKYVELNEGKTFVNVSDISYKFPGKVDDSTFAKP